MYVCMYGVVLLSVGVKVTEADRLDVNQFVCGGRDLLGRVERVCKWLLSEGAIAGLGS